MKKAIYLAVVFCLMFEILFLPSVVSSASAPQICIREEHKSGDYAVLTVFTSQRIENVGGMMITITFDDSKIGYVSGSRKIKSENIKISDASRDSSLRGRIVFSVDSSSPFELNGDIVSYQFNRKSADANCEIKVTVNELYRLDSSLSGIELISDINSINLQFENEAASAVIAKIDSIGDVTLESETKIVDARNSYNSLKTDEKLLVNNFRMLVSAETKLSELKKLRDEAELKRLAEGFKSDYSDILSKTVKNLTLSDEGALNEAINAYNGLSVAQRRILIDQKNHLNRLKTRISELKRLQENEMADELAKKEAEQLASEWKKTWASFINLKESEADSGTLLGITSAIGAADSNAIMNSFFLDYVKNEYEYLKKLAKIAESGNGNLPSADKEAARFMADFGYLLNLSAENVSKADEIDIRTAIAYFDLLSDDAKTKLGNDIPDRLSDLLRVIENLDDGTEGFQNESNSSDKTDTQVIIKESPKNDDKVSTVNVKSPSGFTYIYWLLGLLGVTLLLTAAAAAVLFFLRKKEKCSLGEEEMLC